MKEALIIEERYEEVLSELVQYETLNKKLEEEVGKLSDEVNYYRSQVEEFSRQILDSSGSQNSSENFELRKKLESAEIELGKLRQKENILPEPEVENPREFLTSCLEKIATLENHLHEVQQ